MNFSQLEIFAAVASTGSVTAAARQIHRVPSNITTRLKQLEEDLGVDLFIRENQRLRLSPAGHNLLHYSAQILSLAAEARKAVTGNEPHGIFSLGSLESTAAVRIPQYLAQFNQLHPRIQLDLTTGPSGKILDEVLAGTLSAAFIDGPVIHPAIEGLPVFREEMVVISPAKQPAFRSPQEVSGQNIYAFRSNCSYRRHFEGWFLSAQARPGKIYEMESYHGMLACVISGAGLAMLPRSMLDSMPGGDAVRVHVPDEHWRWLDTWIIWRRGAKTPALDAMIELLPVQEEKQRPKKAKATR